ncbi:hypothetical protein ACFFF7_01810 [Novosphingobium aquiterrae]|uniref:Lipoprotein n=1 Tax=Novosphingobium aquiterrae TaxID=624388 RepID=A0ABV6PE93_9SPHN
MRIRTLCILPLLAMPAGCDQLFADVVHQPQSVVLNQLHYMPNAANLMEMPRRFPNTAMRIDSGDGVINWTYAIGGQDSCRFTAHVAKEGEDRSTVWTTIEDISPGGEGYLCGSINVAGKESVAATLEGRAGDRMKVEKELALVMVGNMASVQKSLGKQIVDMAPKKMDCREYGSTEMQDACRTREFLREHERQQPAR